MILKRVGLTNFRNWRGGAVEFAPGATVLWGGNGQGKTNLLEAVVLACGGRGLRAGADADLITWGEEEAAVRAAVESRVRGNLDIRLRVGQSGRALAVNGTARPLSALIGLVGLVYFCPEDVNIAKGEPVERRRFLDVEIGAMSRSYYFNLMRYRRVLEQRNRALKDIRDRRASESALSAWDEPLADWGTLVMRRRTQFIASLHPCADQASRQLSGSPLALHYEPGLGAVHEDETQARQAFLAATAAARGEDISRGLTTLGPHRDDFAIICSGVDIRRFGSEGEQRSAAAALRLGLITVLEGLFEEPPLLLLDDVFSELDQARREGLAQAVAGTGQVLVTCANLPLVPGALLDSANLVKIECGGAVVGAGVAQ